MFYTAAYLQERKDCKGWRGFLDYKDAEGKRRKKSKTLKATGKADAKRELAAWRAEMENAHEIELARGPEAVSAANRTVPDYVDSFIDSLEARQAIEASSVKGYRSSAKFIRKEFSGVTVEDLKPEQVERWETKLTESGLSSSTVGKAHRLLKQAFKNAVNCRVVDFNPVDPVKPPKRRNKKAGINALDVNGRTELLSRLEGMELTPVTVAARIALFTGLRRGEICALRWQDVDLEVGVIWVRQAIGEGKGGFYIKSAKTDKVRDVALPKSLADLLIEWRRVQRVRFAEKLSTLDEGSYVLGDPLGYLSPHTLSRGWDLLAQTFGIRGTEGRLPTFHDLRHTWATMYLAAGGDVKTAASNLGHANAAMTLNVYASADPNAKREAARLTEVAMTRRPADVLPFTGTEG